MNLLRQPILPTLELYHLPRLAPPPEDLVDRTVVVIDQLRASTTICAALAAGAECVMPFAEITEALAAAESFGRENVLLGGERGGKLIPGFDLGNSPDEYTADRVNGRRILFTTTNGARALQYAGSARRVVVGATVNRAALVANVSGAESVLLLCAGVAGEIAAEDTLAGGAIADAIVDAPTGNMPWRLNPQAEDALRDWRQMVGAAVDANEPLANHLARQLRDTPGGRNLLAIGLDGDLPRCARIDDLSAVPQLDPVANELRPA